MKYDKNLIQENLNKLKNKDWYHQRFDGCPYLIQMIAENELKDEIRKRKVGGVHTIRVCFFNNDRADWYIPLTDLNKTTSKIISLAKTNPSLSKKLLNK